MGRIANLEAITDRHDNQITNLDERVDHVIKSAGTRMTKAEELIRNRDSAINSLTGRVNDLFEIKNAMINDFQTVFNRLDEFSKRLTSVEARQKPGLNPSTAGSNKEYVKNDVRAAIYKVIDDTFNEGPVILKTEIKQTMCNKIMDVIALPPQ